MRLKRNYIFSFIMEILSGILTFILCLWFGDYGLAGIILFFAALFVTGIHIPDEREIHLLYKAGTWESILTVTIMAVVYLWFKEINWFHTLVALSAVTRGTAGLLFFTRE